MSRLKPNLIYILADDMGYGDVSCLNKGSKIRTVNLDRLASGGMVFRDAHATSALCTPSRYGILTGRYNWRSKLKRGVTQGYSEGLIERGRMTVASYLKEKGYATGCVGKWHLGWKWARNSERVADVDYTQPVAEGPASHGFDYFFGISASLDMPPYVFVENEMPTAAPNRIAEGMTGRRLFREGPIAPNFAPEGVLPKLTEKAVAFVENSVKESHPFFLYFPLTAPHSPILPTPEFKGKSRTNEYGDFCLQVDDVVGQLMSALKRNGIEENTIIVFTSDNGAAAKADFEELAKLGHCPSYVFRGRKADIYEGGHRIPLIVRWPDRITAGSVTHETVCLVDLLATCADILNDTLPDDCGEDSVSNLPLWRGEKLDRALREATVHHSGNGSFSIRQGRWKLEMCPGSGGTSFPRPGEECECLPPIQLYNLDADLGERTNVHEKNPEVVERLKALLTNYVLNGRSTPGTPQKNFGGELWEQLWWMFESATSTKA